MRDTHTPLLRRRRTRWGAAALLAVAAALAVTALGSAAGTVLYVDRGNAACTDVGSGASSQPFCTVAAAAAKVLAGQTVEVASGTYPEAVTVSTSGTSSAPIVFTAAPGAVVTLTGGSNGFDITGRSWITVNGFRVTGTTSYGITVSSSSRITLTGNDVSAAGRRTSGESRTGIRLVGVTDSIVARNRSHDNSDHGIYLNNGTTRVTVEGNRTYNNARGWERAAAGIRLYSSAANTVRGNISYANEDSGIESYTGSNNTLLVDNVTYGNGDHGIDNYQSTGQRLLANTVYSNVTAGINVEGSSTGATIANNISVDNGIDSPRTKSNIRVDSASVGGTTMDYDLVHLTRAGTTLIWNSTSYSSLAAFRAATGREQHGREGDPRWIDRANGDFHLLAGSPAIDSADSGVTGQPSVDLEGTARVDDPSTADAGAGPRTYDDRGAYEYGAAAPDSAPLAALTVAGSGPLTVAADASASTDGDATPIATYRFSFGDGSAPVGPQAGATATHSYASGGSYTVTVTVTDTAGLSSTASATIDVAAGDAPPAAALVLSPSQGTAPLAVTADASGSTDADATPIESYRFDFGDGAVRGPQPEPSASHVYTAPGTYTVEVLVTDTAGLSSTSTRSVQVNDAPPVAAVSVTPGSGTAPLAVTADASASRDDDGTPIASYRFDFGDGTTAVGPQPGATATHTYGGAGAYTVTVTVTDTAGLSSSATATVTVTADAPPVAALSLSTASGKRPLVVTADASASTDTDSTPIAGYRFDFGDGSPVVGPQAASKATHTYTAVGSFTVSVTVTDTAGLSSTATKKVKVR